MTKEEQFDEIQLYFRESYVSWVNQKLSNLGRNLEGDRENHNHYHFCQCETEKFIKFAGNKFNIRMYIFMATMFDEILFSHFGRYYDSNAKDFLRFPNITQHHFFEHVGADWVLYDMREKELGGFSWENSEETIDILMIGFKKWFLSVASEEEYQMFLYRLRDFAEELIRKCQTNDMTRYSYLPLKNILDKYFVNLKPSVRFRF